MGSPLTFVDLTQNGQLLSAELDPAEGELEWFKGRRMQPSEVFAMFGLQKEASAETAKENAKSDRRSFGCLTMLLSIVALCGWGVGCNQHGKVVATQGVTASQIDADGMRLGPFPLTAAGKVHRLRLWTNGLAQTSVFTQAVIEDDQGPVFDADAEFWDESGVDSDGSWHESDVQSQTDFKLAKAGNYYVRLTADPETAASNVPVNFAIEQGVMHPTPLAVFGWIGLPLGFIFLIAGSSQTTNAVMEGLADD